MSLMQIAFFILSLARSSEGLSSCWRCWMCLWECSWPDTGLVRVHLGQCYGALWYFGFSLSTNLQVTEVCVWTVRQVTYTVVSKILVWFSKLGIQLEHPCWSVCLFKDNWAGGQGQGEARGVCWHWVGAWAGKVLWVPQVSHNHDLNTLASSSPGSGGTSSPWESGWWVQLLVCVEWLPGLGCRRWHMLHRYVPFPHTEAPECGSNTVLGEAHTTRRWESLHRGVGEIGSSTHSLPLG